MGRHVVCQPLVEIQILSPGCQCGNIQNESERPALQQMVEDL